MIRTKRLIILASTALAVGLATAGCGGSSPAGDISGSTSTAVQAPHNVADVQFATEMIAHHRQAIVMADQVLRKTSNTKVRVLARNIKNAQTPEIVKMSNWLHAWNEPVPTATTSDSMGGMDMGGMDMGGASTHGMMTPAQMTEMSNATPANSALTFLQLMPLHHFGAIAMARTELAKGQSPAAQALARSIIKSQSAQIHTMRSLMAGLK